MDFNLHDGGAIKLINNFAATDRHFTLQHLMGFRLKAVGKLAKLCNHALALRIGIAQTSTTLSPLR